MGPTPLAPLPGAPPFGAPPQPPTPPDPGSGRRLLLGLGAVLVLLGLIGGLFVAPVATSSGDDGEELGADDEDEPDPTTTTPDAPTEAELAEAVAEAKAFVEEKRGLAFQEDVPVELLDGDAFVDRLLQDFDEENAAELADAVVLYEALGIVEPGTDLAAAMREALAGGVVGFYDPELGNLVLRGAALTPATRVTLVHELTHALDDQHFELDRTYDESEISDGDGDGRPDEIGFGFLSVVEGNATVVDEAYKATLSDEEQEQFEDEHMEMAGDLPDVPFFILELISLPYILGPQLITALDDEGGQERVNAAFETPPSTSEGVLHPDKFLDGEAAVDVPKPEAEPGGEVVWPDSVFGEVFTLMVLTEELDLDDGRDAAEGWGGDRAVTWRDGDRSCVRDTVVGDSADETEELHEAWTEWAESADVEATIDPLDGDAPFTLTSCSPVDAAGGNDDVPA